MKYKFCSFLIWLFILDGCTHSHFATVGSNSKNYVIGDYTLKHILHYNQHMIEFNSNVENCSGMLVLGDNNFQYLPNQTISPISYIIIENQKYQFCYYEKDSLRIWQSDLLPITSIETPGNIKLILQKIDSISTKIIPHYESQFKYWARLNRIDESHYKNQ